jgi:hypothetical protein
MRTAPGLRNSLFAQQEPSRFVSVSFGNAALSRFASEYLLVMHGLELSVLR